VSYFLFKLNPPRATFAQDMTAEERQVMQAHGTYWHSLAERGIAIFVGPVADPAGAWGVGIVEVEDEATARSLVHDDPASRSSIPFRYEMFPVMRAILRDKAR
jgi:uncharacterized protein YciI